MALGLVIGTLGILLVLSCSPGTTHPAVPIAMDLYAHTVDGSPVPVWIEERPGVGSHLVSLHLHMTSDGFWTARGVRYVDGATPADTSAFIDNGVYSFDGKTLGMHSNWLHVDWPATFRGDTISASVLLPDADARHTVSMW